MRIRVSAVVAAVAVPLACMAQHPAPLDAPLPDPMQLLNRALANEKKVASEQERYECRVTAWSAETDKTGKIKKQDTTVSEQFFVNGQEIQHTLEKDGKSRRIDLRRCCLNDFRREWQRWKGTLIHHPHLSHRELAVLFHQCTAFVFHPHRGGIRARHHGGDGCRPARHRQP